MAEQRQEHPAPEFPTYEELAADLIDGLARTSLVAEDVVHELEPGTGERTFHVSVRLGQSETEERYGARLHFHWDALLTYVGVYGPGSECDLYHEEDETCSHRGRPRAFIELVAEYGLGDGGYELSELGEVDAWIQSVEGLLNRSVPDQQGRILRLELAIREGAVWVDRFFAEQSWELDLNQPADLEPICQAVAATLRATPALADRLPL